MTLPLLKLTVVTPETDVTFCPTKGVAAIPVRLLPSPIKVVAVITPMFRFGVPVSPVAVPVKFPPKVPVVVAPDTTIPPVTLTFPIGATSCAFCC